MPESDGCTGSFGSLLGAVWCPICGGKLSVVEKDGKKVLCCARHGVMKCFVDSDPRVASVFVGGCGEVRCSGC